MWKETEKKLKEDCRFKRCRKEIETTPTDTSLLPTHVAKKTLDRTSLSSDNTVQPSHSFAEEAEHPKISFRDNRSEAS